ncbi:MAG: mechanosensitive ion channel [Halanaerobiales bacterium]
MQFENIYNSVRDSFSIFINKYLLSYYNLIQITFILLLFGISYLIEKKYKEKLISIIPDSFILKETLDQLFKLIIYSILLWTYILVSTIAEIPYYSVIIIVNLLSAWIVINLLSELIKNKLLSKIFSILIWSIAALHLLGIYNPVVNFLDKIAFSSGNIHISLLMVIKGVLTLFIFFWIAKKLTAYSERKIKKIPVLTLSIKVLLIKVFKFLIFSVVVLITMSSLGINLTALTVIGGAVGVGIGFGMKTVISNFISGIVILIDKSVKPGDIIEIEDVYGEIKSISLRYTSLLTLGGKEYIIPNEDLITEKVINWSYSDSLVRTTVTVGVSYNSDVEKALELMEKSIKGIDRILDKPSPKIFLKEFGDSSINLEIRFWIEDPENGMADIKSEINKNIWNLFKENDIKIPYPQQDIHFKSVSPELKEFIKENN